MPSARVLLTALWILLLPSLALAQERIQAGKLECVVAGGQGFIFGLTKSLTCDFNSIGGRHEIYAGTIRKYGVDIGATEKTVLVWGVLAPSRHVPPGALDGNYGGLSDDRRRAWRKCPHRRLVSRVHASGATGLQPCRRYRRA